MSILIRNVLLDGERRNVLIEGNRFGSLNAPGNAPADEVIDAGGFAILPAFYNTHSHSPMTLLRGYADDMELFTWLNDHIWPFEAQMKPEDIYAGTRLAILEMIKSGTVFFCDMYWMEQESARAAAEMGVRACVSVHVIGFQPREAQLQTLARARTWKDQAEGRVTMAVAAHAPYTCGAELIVECHDLARELGMPFVIHLAETRKEFDDCVGEHGMTPVQYLDSLGVLDRNTVAAHVVHVTDEDAKILADREVVISHNPVSNMKLASGVFQADKLQKAGCRITLGTDGASSNNNLSMIEEMKVAALLAKVSSGPLAGSAETVLGWASRNGAQAFGLDAGVIREGALADAILVDLANERLVPNHNLLSNWVYSADSSCVDTVICDGRVIMRNRKIPGEQQIREQAQQSAERILARLSQAKAAS